MTKGTIKKNYGYSLRELFLPWAEQQGISDPDQLDQRLLDRYTGDLLQRDISPHTAHSYVRPLRQLLSWGQKAGDVGTDARPQLPRLNRKVIDVLSDEEIDRMEAVADTERNKLIVRILADTGIRSGELCKLRVNDTTRREHGTLLKVQGKGGKERLVPIRPELARRIDRFAQSRPRGSNSNLLFLSRRRSASGEYPPITGSGVGQMIEELVDKAGIDKRVYPHLLRHSFATERLRRGMNPIQLARIMGHSSLQMIDKVYSHLTATDAYDAMMRTFD